MDGSIAPVLDSAEPLAILAGGGTLPLIVASAAVRAGRSVTIVGIEGEAGPEIAAYPHEWVGWGEVGKLLLTLRQRHAQDLVLVGRIASRPDYDSLPLDRGGRIARKLISEIFHGGDNAVLSGAVRLLEARGYRVVGAHEIAHELLPQPGWLTRAHGGDGHLRDARIALDAASAIGTLDVGQAAIAIDGRVVALEGAEGTDGMIERVAALRGTGRIPAAPSGVLAKCAKPHQDLRVDMPTIGPDTADAAAAAGLEGIVVEAGRVMVAEREETIRRANARNLFLRVAERSGPDD